MILDRSGSMQDCVNETIAGFNEQVQMIRDLQQKFPEQEFRVSLSIFDHIVEHIFEIEDVKKIRELNDSSYIPSGSTALLDAIGDSVIRLKHAIKEEIDRDEATAVVVILTDGFENASREFSFERVGKLIKELETGDSWTFSFLGTTKESIDMAVKMNISRNNTAVYNKSATHKTYQKLGNSLGEYFESKQIGIKSKDFLKNN